jgi:nifR3 family TIM-barrel protein
VTDRRPDLIDLNFGCPSRKVVGKNGGAALLKDLSLIEKIIRAVILATDLPVTVKIRSGWDENSIVAPEVAVLCASYGVAAVTVHPRTRQQGFSGRANWDLIRQVKKSVQIPVIGNGDVRTPQDGLRMFQETGCDAIMVGRGAPGNPWLFRQIEALRGGDEEVVYPSLSQRIALCLRHAHQLVDARGEFSGIRQMRKHFAWYTRGFPGGSSLRAALVRMEHMEEVEEALRDYQGALIGEPLRFPSLTGR